MGPSVLFCPGDRPDRYGKALERADTVVLDLEDAVAPEAKAHARGAVVAALPGLPADRVVVRINGTDTPWHGADFAALREVWQGPLMLPKCDGAAAVSALMPAPVFALIENAAGVLNADPIAAADNCCGLMWGSEDLTASLGGTSSREPGGAFTGVSQHARHHTLLAARRHGRIAIDTVHVDFDDEDGLRAEAESAARMGFDAKACIHPRQADVVRAAFRPSPQQLAWARDILEAARRHGGVFRQGGTMIDAPLVAHARAILARGSS
ncbi:CoA ester lyase [Dactylosporangium salmoneum]|uniref:CoA ester lyase n=1 Tax=Dactylosporangium salmoneum TaxID=53361 RepID=A0ABN3FXP3_9ACTN